jgi:hypothetical protein
MLSSLSGENAPLELTDVKLAAGFQRSSAMSILDPSTIAGLLDHGLSSLLEWRKPEHQKLLHLRSCVQPAVGHKLYDALHAFMIFPAPSTINHNEPMLVVHHLVRSIRIMPRDETTWHITITNATRVWILSTTPAASIVMTDQNAPLLELPNT